MHSESTLPVAAEHFAMNPLIRYLLLLLMVQSTLCAAVDEAASRNLRPQATGGSKRVALVIGNGAYRAEDLKPLANPVNDADDMARELRRFGFEVLAHKNLDRRRMKDAIAEFGRKASNAETALFYYAGHGIQIKNQNYLIPVDAAARSEADIEDEGINVNYPLGEMESARTQVNLVLLDACRNNNFSGKFRSGSSRGLAAPSGNLPKGTVIVYATDPGNVASDGSGRNGLFTEGLLSGFKGQDLSLDGVLTKASEVVEQKSNGKQTPYINGPKLVQRNFYFIFQGPATVNVQNSADPETETWRAAEGINSASAYRDYLSAYPNGRYAAAARIKLNALDKPSAPQPVFSSTVPSSVASSKPDSEMHPGKVFRDCADCPEMVVIPAGSFSMGGTEREQKPVHRVNLRTFGMAKTEVTQAQWQAVMGSNPSADKQCGSDCPVEKVSWDDAQEFIRRFNAKTGKSYRLPSEAEWEYACRAGRRDKYCGGNNLDAVSWHGDNSKRSKKPVAGKQANAWGLYDMSGNVAEWTQDCWKDNYRGARNDGSAWTSGDCSIRVARGGDFTTTGGDGINMRSEDRGGGIVGNPGVWVTGFRLARTLSP
jgi:formylglycine-generating enzyme required for sulfatase activity